MLIFREASKIWNGQNYAGDLDLSMLELENKLQQKMLSLFSVGDYYNWIFHLPSVSFPHVSPEIIDVLGYRPEEMTVEMILSIIHPEDKPYFLNFENKVMEFFAKLSPEQVFKYKPRYDYRVRKKNGQYIRILQQVLTIQSDENGSVIATLGVHTDITHLKNEGVPVLSFIGMDGEPSYENVTVEKVFDLSVSSDRFSNREKEILLFLIEGRTSKEIGELLFISAETVNTHRRNMLYKAGAKNTIELIHFSVKNGWI